MTRGYLIWYILQEEFTVIPSNIRLDYPVVGTSMTIYLPKPVFENQEKLEQKRIVRRTRGLSSKVFRDTIWTQYTLLHYICEGCSDEERTNYLEFVELTYGKEVKLTDYENRIWRGILLPGEITQQYRTCGYVIEFDFQGTLI